MVAAVRILVVDDTPEILGIVASRLRERGFDVVTASDGDAALEVARRERPQLALLDVMMPRKSGWDVARALRIDPATEAIRIIIMTALGEDVNRNASPLFGADATLDKPFDLAGLDEVVDRVVATLAR